MPVRIASINVNGVRAAVRQGMLDWIADAEPDVLALQEVRATREQLADALPGWHLALHESAQKGRAGVAIATRTEPETVREGLGDDTVDSAGRWIEADLGFGAETLTAASAYVHTGEADTPKQDAKWGLLDAIEARMSELGASPRLALVMGDLNIAHREADIRNAKGNRGKSGFLPRERAYLDRLVAAAGSTVTATDETEGVGRGWVDIGRRHHPNEDGPYTWWTMRGRAFDTDTGWRIDYHLATESLAERAVSYRVHRAPSWDTRWSDHAPVVADYRIGQ